jgi:hypothetical protein
MTIPSFLSVSSESKRPGKFSKHVDRDHKLIKQALDLETRDRRSVKSDVDGT